MAVTLIHSYRQSGDFRWFAGEVKPHLIGVGASSRADYEPTDTSKGVCFALSVWWIIKSAKGEDFWTWMVGPGKHVADIKNLFRAQKGSDVTRFIVADEKIRAETTLKRLGEVLINESTAFTEAGFYYLSLQGKFGGAGESTGHGIAFCIRPAGDSRLFDPNVGEYRADTTGELMAQLSVLVRGYRISGMSLSWTAWGVA